MTRIGSLGSAPATAQPVSARATAGPVSAPATAGLVAAVLVATALMLGHVTPAAAQDGSNAADGSPLASPAADESPAPSPAQHAMSDRASQPGAGHWPSGDELRRELQSIGFTFRVAREDGDWLGWAPGVSIEETPSLVLDGEGGAGASAAFTFDLLQTEVLSGEIESALTALLEVIPRLPITPRDADRTRRFVVFDLLTEPPEALEPCYADDEPERLIVISIDGVSGLATLHLAPSLDRIELRPAERDAADAAPATDPGPPTEIELEDCAPLVPSTDGVAPGEAVSERITIAMAAGEPPAFDPAEVTVDGAVVTLILTFRNDSDVEQTLTFEEPLEADTGPVAPGDVRLIVVRQLEPGEYPFFSATDPDRTRGSITIAAPAPE